MPRMAGATAAEIRGLVPAAREAWDEIERNVLRSGVVDQRLNDLCYRYLADAIGFELGRQHWRRSVGLPPRER